MINFDFFEVSWILSIKGCQKDNKKITVLPYIPEAFKMANTL